MGGNTIEKCNQVVTAGRDTIPVGPFMHQMDSIAIYLIHEIAQQGQIAVGLFMQSHAKYQVGKSLLSLCTSDAKMSCFVMNQTPFDAETVSSKYFCVHAFASFHETRL